MKQKSLSALKALVLPRLKPGKRLRNFSAALGSEDVANVSIACLVSMVISSPLVPCRVVFLIVKTRFTSVGEAG